MFQALDLGCTSFCGPNSGKNIPGCSRWSDVLENGRVLFLPYPTGLSYCVWAASAFFNTIGCLRRNNTRETKGLVDRHLQNMQCFSGGMSGPWVPRQLLGLELAQDSFLCNM